VNWRHRRYGWLIVIMGVALLIIGAMPGQHIWENVINGLSAGILLREGHDYIKGYTRYIR
jgi:hypothetical protein